MQPHVKLEGQVALVTGGARGLGQAICKRLAQSGVRVAALDIRRELLDATVSSISSEGGKALGIACDICSSSEVEDAFASARREFGRVDILVNNAGTDLTAPAEEIEPDQFERIVKTNLIAPFVLSRLAFKNMPAGGQIVNIVSTAAKRAWDSASAYHASKWGLLGLSHALHVEGRKKKIRVTAVISGGLRTPFLFDRFPDIDPQVLQDPATVADTVAFVLTMPEESVVPEIMVIPIRETSWP